jgi:hypothetical protein
MVYADLPADWQSSNSALDHGFDDLPAYFGACMTLIAREAWEQVGQFFGLFFQQLLALREASVVEQPTPRAALVPPTRPQRPERQSLRGLARREA